jgi:hypothetical protein
VRITGIVQQKPFDYIFDLGDNNFLKIDARGGDGGDGGNGGNGAAGSRGSNGADATEYSSGGNGGDGGPGGNGGDASSGSHGAPGGFVVITLDEEDMDLLYLLGPILI